MFSFVVTIFLYGTFSLFSFPKGDHDCNRLKDSYNQVTAKNKLGKMALLVTTRQAKLYTFLEVLWLIQTSIQITLWWISYFYCSRMNLDKYLSIFTDHAPLELVQKAHVKFNPALVLHPTQIEIWGFVPIAQTCMTVCPHIVLKSVCVTENSRKGAVFRGGRAAGVSEWMCLWGHIQAD